MQYSARFTKRHAQAGKALTQRCGDHLRIFFPDGGAQNLNTWVLKHQSRFRDGYGSHHNGRHKLG